MGIQLVELADGTEAFESGCCEATVTFSTMKHGPNGLVAVFCDKCGKCLDGFRFHA